MASTLELLRRLTRENVEFVLVGGMAAIAHGSATVTEDVDVCIRFDLPTLTGVLRAVAGTNPRQRMHPDFPPLGDSPDPYVGNKNLYLVTDEGVLDLLGEVIALGSYDEIAPRAVTLDLGGFTCRVLCVDDLIASKRQLGRPKDHRTIRELEALREHLKKR